MAESTTKLNKKQKKALKFRSKAKGKTDDATVEVAKPAQPKKNKAKYEPKGNKAANKNKNENKQNKEENQETGGDQSEGKKQVSKHRFIVFVGNLPYDTTKEDLEQLFESAAPTSVRLLTDKQTKKPKGYAFLEFDSPDQLKQALKFHRYGFKSRKINVELTAGGGGNTENRRKKLEQKRKQLENEREKAKDNNKRPHGGDDEDGGSGDYEEGGNDFNSNNNNNDKEAKKPRNRRPKKKSKNY
ncbi:hypothetical protein H4219_003590 [Mycoemilia scoparia]|uniref:RRM domain-containing protein n=1 Tax=Mycoemilia scoparia TaxID=417184 RepID=A0A9W8A2B3_9FUNG|nr:hypothetical protein H4219_003590 [Mycoemilia scoparia]